MGYGTKICDKKKMFVSNNMTSIYEKEG